MEAHTHTPWSVILVDLISRLGFCSQLLVSTMGFNKLVRRCHSHLDFVLSKALPGSPHSVVNNCLGSAFGLRRQVAFGAHLVRALPPISGLFSSRQVFIVPTIY